MQNYCNSHTGSVKLNFSFLLSDATVSSFNEKGLGDDLLAIKELLVEKHEFSVDRVDKQLQKLRDIKEKAKQKGLGNWI